MWNAQNAQVLFGWLAEEAEPRADEHIATSVSLTFMQTQSLYDCTMYHIDMMT